MAKDTNILMGFEVECCIDSSRYLTFKNRITRINPHIGLGTDCSINSEIINGARSTNVEIRTPPLPTSQALRVLRRVFSAVNRYGLTNRSCGLHVNVSSSDLGTMQKFDPYKFADNPLWDAILKNFDRQRNDFCKPIFNKTPASKVEFYRKVNNAFYDKYCCISFRNFLEEITRSTRVEVRGFGNKDYSKRYSDIAPVVRQIEKNFLKACR